LNDFVSKNYRKILELRREGLGKYHSQFPHQFIKVPTAFSLPGLVVRENRRSALHASGLRHYDIGSRICIMDKPVPWVVASRLIHDGQSVLDIGCSDGMFEKFLKVNGISVHYAGVEVDTSFSPDFELYRSLKDVRGKFDIITLFHVIEHMPLNEFLDLLAQIPALLKGPEIAILATPNVLSPGVFERDIEHVQPYPWFDLYAILRLYFSRVDVLRGHYLCTPLRVISIPVKAVAGVLREQDWCEEVVLIAKRGNINSAGRQ